MQSRTWGGAKFVVLKSGERTSTAVSALFAVAVALGTVAATVVIATSLAIAASPASAATKSSKSLLPKLPSWVKGRIAYGLWLPTQIPTDQTTGLTGDYKVLQSDLSSWLELDPEFGTGFSAHGKGTLDAIFQTTVMTTSETVKTGVRATFREGYGQYSKGSWDVRAGRQIIPWGKSDGINPTDFLGAKTAYLLWTDEESKRFGSDSVSANFVPAGGSSPWGFTVVGTAIYPRSSALITKEITGNSVQIYEGDRNPDAVSSQRGELAAKVSYFGNGFDFDFIAFTGRRHLPQYAFKSVTLSPPVQVGVESRYEQIQALGANASYNWNDWQLREEIALTHQISEELYNPLILPVYLDSVLGVERLFSNKIRAQGQWIYRYFTHFVTPTSGAATDPIQGQFLDQLRHTNALIQGMLYKDRHAFSLRVSYEREGSDVVPEVFLLSYLNPGEGILQPKVTMSIKTSWKLALGAIFFYGPGDQAIGALNSYSSVYGELRYLF